MAEKFGFEVDVAKQEDWARDDFSPELHEGVFGTAVGELMREPAPMAKAIRLGRPRRGNGTPSGPVRGDERPSEAAYPCRVIMSSKPAKCFPPEGETAEVSACPAVQRIDAHELAEVLPRVLL